MREQKKPTVKLVRGADGKLRTVSTENDAILKELWDEQGRALNTEPTTLKQDVKNYFKNKKQKSTKTKQASGSTKGQKPKSQNKVATIAVTIPSLKIPSWLNPKKLPKKYVIAGVSTIALIGTIWLAWPSGGSPPLTDEQQGEVAGQIQFKVTPEYAVMSPGGAGVESLGGYALISPPGEPKVYAYTDTIGGVPIKVSQQELPDSIGQDELKLRDLASNFNATEQIQVDDRSAYVGRSVNGVQSVIFARENIMVLIASDAEISNKDWVTYLGDLRF